MPTSHTITSLKNRALDMISEFPIEGPLDAGVYARWLNRNYAPTVESALRQQPWNFACEFFLLLLDPTPPIMRYRYRYELPNGWIRVLQPTRDGYRNGFPIKFAVQGNYVLTNELVTKGFELVMNKQEPGLWDALFADLVAARLATGMAQRFTAKNTYVDRCKQLADDAFRQAEEINTFEGSVPEPEQEDIIRVRGYENDWFDNRNWR